MLERRVSVKVFPVEFHKGGQRGKDYTETMIFSCFHGDTVSEMMHPFKLVDPAALYFKKI